MIQKVNLLIINILLPVLIYSQSNIQQREINWKISGTYSVKEKGETLKKGKYLNFEGAVFHDPIHQLPFYTASFPVEQGSQVNLDLRISDASRLNDTSLLNEHARNLIDTTLRYSYKVLKSRGKRFLFVEMIPLIRKEGVIKKINSFHLIIHSEEVKTQNQTISGLDFADHSIFQKGKWLKIAVEKTGVYKLTYGQLREKGFSNFNQLGLFGNGEGVLSQDNRAFRDRDPAHVPVKIFTGNDGVFNEGDYLLFFGKSSQSWNYDKEKRFFSGEKHPYSKYNYYFITPDADSAGAMPVVYSSQDQASEKVTSFLDYNHYEDDAINLIKSGREWFGEKFGLQNQYDFDFDFPNRMKSKKMKLSARVAARSSLASEFSVYLGEEKVFDIPVNRVYFDNTSYFAREGFKLDSLVSDQEEFKVRIEYNRPNSSSQGWLDYITVNAHRKLTMEDDQMLFRHHSHQPGKVVEFVLSGIETDVTIWDVTNPTSVSEIRDIQIKDGEASFRWKMDSTWHEFIAFTGASYLKPELMGEVKNQDLHGLAPADMIIITKEKFLSQAQKLAALHQQHDGLKTVIATDKEIFNEFSSGCPDPSAFRNFVRFMYEKSTPEDSLKYLLFFGDGSFDNRECHTNGELLTYQSKESLHYSNSFVSDDFFGMLDETDNIEGGYLSGLVDIGIGRLPVNTAEQAETAVEKIKTYLVHTPKTDWLNKIIFVADDEDNNDHEEDAEELSSYVSNQYGEFDIGKIYLDAYEQQTTSTGDVYPGVNKAINEKINNGVLLLNYSGHGGEHYLAHERILTKDDIAGWENRDRLPVFMTGTCEFTRFDNPYLTSAGEEIFLREAGGAIALFSTTRLVYANQNFALNKAFYNFVFRKNGNPKNYRLGDIVRMTKNNAGTDDNKRNFSLFGDPALRLPVGQYEVTTDSIVHNNGQVTDTIQALDEVTIYGHVKDRAGNLAEDFNGLLFVKAKGKKQAFYTLANDGGSTFAYTLRGNRLFHGKTKVDKGRFSIHFIAPQNIGPEYGKGKIIYWGEDENTIAQGAYDEFYTGGKSGNSLDDYQGPEIRLYMNDRKFKSGGVTNESPRLIADFSDESGINISSMAPGHDIMATIDNNYEESVVLNDYYQADTNTYKSGTLTYQLDNLQPGKHTLSLEAWDLNNNYTRSSIDFYVAESSEFQLTKIYNYPNPFRESTEFYFEHNRPYEPMEVTLELFNLTGRRVAMKTTKLTPAGFRVGPVQWNGMNQLADKMGPGVYLYRIKIRLNDGKEASKSEKLIIVK